MRHILPLVLMMATASVAMADIRVYQPPTPPAKPVAPVSRGIDTPAKPDVSTPKMAVPVQEPVANTPAPAAQTMPRQLEVFLNVADIQRMFPQKVEELRKLEELQKLNLVPKVYIDRESTPTLMQAIKKMIPKNLKLKDGQELENVPGMPNLGFALDYGNELAKGYGIQGQSTIVYRDPAGAVRLYNLGYEVEKLQRQLAREIQDAQPAR